MPAFLQAPAFLLEVGCALLVLAAAALSSVVITALIVLVLVYESAGFFGAKEVRLSEFFTGTEWAPLFHPAKYGILPLVSATVMTTLIALAVALPRLTEAAGGEVTGEVGDP